MRWASKTRNRSRLRHPWHNRGRGPLRLWGRRKRRESRCPSVRRGRRRADSCQSARARRGGGPCGGHDARHADAQRIPQARRCVQHRTRTTERRAQSDDRGRAGLALTESAASPLSEREQEVVALITQGCSNREIAKELTIAEATAVRHVANILDKLGLKSRAQVAVWAVERRFRSRLPEQHPR